MAVARYGVNSLRLINTFLETRLPADKLLKDYIFLPNKRIACTQNVCDFDKGSRLKSLRDYC